MITADMLISKCEQPLEEGWGYIWGATGQVWTKEAQESTTNEQAKAYGKQWIGKRVVDCSGLLYWAFRQLGGYICHGSNTIWNRHTVKSTRGTLKNGKRTDGKKIRPGSAVFLTETKADGTVSRHHVGLYVGRNVCVEAKGTKSGVVVSDLSRWDEAAELKDVSYDGEAVRMTLRQGCSGAEVKALQRALIELGYGTVGTADGIFGPKTEKAVRQFQEEHGLAVDGIAGEKTLAEIDRITGAGTEPEPERKEQPEKETPVLRDYVKMPLDQAMAMFRTLAEQLGYTVDARSGNVSPIDYQ